MESERAAPAGGPHSQSSEQRQPAIKFPATLQALPRAADVDGFDWESDDAVILREQRATAAYRNKAGELIIRQRAGPLDDEDSFIYIASENAVPFMEALAKRAREG